MKKLYFLMLAAVVSFSLMAQTTHQVTSSGILFSPADITITEGDDVQFSEVSGSHPVLEVSEATWNANGSTGNGGFSIPSGNGTETFNTAGEYFYICTNHIGNGMKGKITVQAAPSGATPWINEIHYDNAGGDVDEGVEIAGTSGTDLTCYSLLYYNGSNDSQSDSISLTGTIDDEGCGYGAVWFDKSGIQNGSPDGIALYNHCTGTLIQFLSYEGTMTAGDGSIAGEVSTDIGVVESGAQVIGGSLQLMGSGTDYASFTWDSTGVNSYDVLNPNQSLCGAVIDTFASFASASASVNEGAATYDITVTLSQAATGSVDVVLTSGTAANINNYTTQTVNFSASNSETVTITWTDDATIEADEDFTFELQNISSGLMAGANTSFTLTIEDNDTPLPTYSIADLTTVDADGNPDSLGVEVELDVVVMGVNYATSPDISFFIHDGASGMGVYDGSGIGYTVNEGDQITIKGEVGFFNGLTQIVDVTEITMTGTGTLPAVATVSALNESTEGELVKLENVTVTNQSDWATGTGAGFDVDVTDGTNTYSVRIDNGVDLYNMMLPGCVLDVTGIGTQYDDSSPYDEGYQLLPRYTADIVVIDTCAVAGIVDETIANISMEDASGIASSLNGVFRVVGTVNSPDRGFNSIEFSMQDGGAGITIKDDAFTGYEAEVGDEIEVVGTVAQDVGVVLLEDIQSISIISSSNTVTEDVVTAMNDANESTLVRFNDLTLVDASQWSAAGGAGFTVQALDQNGDTVAIRIDRDYDDLYNSSAPSAPTFDIIGVSSQFTFDEAADADYQIIPRFLSDIIQDVAVNHVELENLSIYPNPATDIVNVSFEAEKIEAVTISVFNTLGALVSTTVKDLNTGMNNVEINVANLTTGIYFVEIQIEAGKTTQRIAVK